MHRIDKVELLGTLTEARREAKLMLAELAGAHAAARLRRIIVLLGYMAEHLEMVGTRAHRCADAALRDKQNQ